MDLDSQFADYAAHHAHPLNKATHYVGLPLIALCLFGLGSKLVLARFADGIPLDAGWLLAVALVAVYTFWRWKLALGVAVVFMPLYLLGAALPVPWLLGLLAVGVALQYVGHFVFEKRAPAFHRNLVHTLVGPLWIAASFFGLLGGAAGGAGRTLRRLAGALALLLALLLLWLAGRILVPLRYEDAAHLEAKRAYLARVAAAAEAGSPRPNVVLVLFDDLGYGDLGAYGGGPIRTPQLDRLAAEGARFTHAYATSPYCSASRAGLLTGRYPVRAGLDHVLQPAGFDWDLLLRLGRRNRRLPADEITLAEVLSAAGYATGIFGKWHLGERSPSLPNDLGFDRFYGLLHSNDQGEPAVREDGRVVEPHPIDQTTLTRRYTERAVAFLEEHRARPFFLYLPHTFPHIPLHVTGDRLGRSAGGLYGDVVEELDWSVGRVVETLDRLGLAERTLVLATSDNGPWFQGSPGGTRGRKLDIFEGGMRVPFIARWPGRIAGGRVIDQPVMGIDLFPTLLDLAGVEPPADRLLDGASLAPLLEKGEVTEERELLYFQLGVLRAVRQGRFKYFDRRRIFYGNPMNWVWGPMIRRGPWLFDLESDPDESYDVSHRHPEVAARLGRRLAQRAAEHAANPRGWS